MPIQTWQAYEPPDPNLQQRGDRQIAHGEGIALQYTLGGDPMTNQRPMNATGENSAPAARYNSNAPYREPHAADRPEARDKRCKAKDDTCMGWATASGYCRPHTVG